jgi:hypothetical protein
VPPYWLNVTVKQVWVLWHRGIEASEIANELTRAVFFSTSDGL